MEDLTSLLVSCLQVAMPIAFAFAMTKKIVNFLFSMMFGKEKINL